MSLVFQEIRFAKRLKKKTKKICVFCGSTRLTGEHFWPVWSHPCLAIDPSGGRTRELHETLGNAICLAGPNSRVKSSHLANLKLRLVCARCNNGWMSHAEETAKPVLVKLINGERCCISVNEQEHLARWIAMKVMLAEHDRNQVFVTPQEERTTLMEDGVIPPTFDIRIAHHGLEQKVGYVRRAMTIMMGDGSGKAPEITGNAVKNVQDTHFMFGKLLVVAASSQSNMRIEDMFRVHADGLPRIWPCSSEALDWPPPLTLNFKQVSDLARRLDYFVTANRSIWLQHPSSPVDLGFLGNVS